MTELLTTREVAERLKVHPDTVRDWINSGQLIPVNVSSKPIGQPRHRVSVDELERFIRRRTKTTTPAPSKRSKIKRVYT